MAHYVSVSQVTALDESHDCSSPAHQESTAFEDGSQPLDLSSLPPIYISPTHFDTEDLHELEEALDAVHAVHTYDLGEAEIILSKATKKPRIRLDLKAKGLNTTEWQAGTRNPARTLASEDEQVLSRKRKHDELNASLAPEQTLPPGRIVKVVSIEWFTDSRKSGHVLPLDQYMTYTGIVQAVDEATTATLKPKLPVHKAAKLTATSQHAPAGEPTKPLDGSEILQRAQDDASHAKRKYDRFGKRQYHHPHHVTPSANPASWEAGHGTNAKHAHLLQQTTTEYEGSSSDTPEMPKWVKSRVKYACQRLTPKTNPNDDFIALLKEIKQARLLTNDEIGVRAYSTSIAAIAAYMYRFSTAKEILALPGCDHRIANLWVEWKNTGTIKAVEDARNDDDLKILRLFYNIWGVGVATARDFYFERGWRDLDDIVEYGWSTLVRVQQIGVKYYDEFLDLIPRAEVEQICEVIRKHAVKVRDDGIQSIIVGGYRRGKEASGDVDIVVTHPDESCTLNLVNDVVASLEEEEWITHTLTLSEASSERDQQTLPFRAGGGGHGFDTLDKALVVWQNPAWPTKAQDLAQNPKAKNPNIHRRVDIIISPWRTVGCAVVGWSGGTTFERDLRRYAKNVKGWKFDSSGVRNRGNGEVVDLEGYFSWKGKERKEGRAKTIEEAERRVFEGFGLAYREPWERCTG
ncbi:DNA polymerase type-X family protein pol4 [Pseudocercospora fuligena]|uniref:DNA polymerase n=1 Tax=Pseudocercospora fuligena TaxID=685502 RepID=A0A8H6RLL1_9PEZI|nr:DNA polymerase type-X family protein pol4 [Pseudocercospora fuligena]